MNLAQISMNHGVVVAVACSALVFLAGLAGMYAKHRIAGKQTAGELLAKVDEVQP